MINYRIMFVCHGNICRSPMAEFVFKKMIKDSRLENLFEVSSCATSSEEIWNGIGNPVYPPAAKKLSECGISCSGKRAVQLCKDDYNKYDLFIGMDSANIRNMHRIFGSDPDGKISKLLNYDGRSDDVADPWYSGDFDKAYNDIYVGCKALFETLKNNMNK